MVKNLPANAGDPEYAFDPWVRKIPLEEEMATHFSILAWRTIVQRVAKSYTQLSTEHAGLQKIKT